VQGALGVALGERVPPGVALATFATEFLLAWIALALWVCGLAIAPGLRSTARDRGLRQAGLLLGLGLFVGGSWLLTARPTAELPAALGAWLVGHGLGLVVLQRSLRAVGRLPQAGLDAFSIRAGVAAAASLGCLAAIHHAVGASEAAARPWVFALAQGLAGGFGAAAALSFGTGSPTPTDAGAGSGPLRVLLRVAVAAVLLGAFAFALHEPGPRRPWREQAAPQTSPAGAAGPRLPNLVLVSLDTLSSAHVGAYGYGRDTTPVLDSLASEGALFEHTISTAPWTLPSHGSLFTGRYPGDLAGYRIHGTPSLAPLLRERGYRTAAFTAGYVMGEAYFGEGFDLFADDYEEAYVLGLAPTFLQAGLRLRRGARHLGFGFAPLNPVNHWRLEGGGVNAFAGPLPPAEAAADWIRDYADEGPFFLFFHSFGAHEYYLATEEMRRRADRWAGDYAGWLRATSLRFGSEMPSATEDLRYLVALYDASIQMSDAALGIVLRALAEAGVAGNTVVVVTADHGEGFRPDLGRTWHLGRLHDDLVRVPLVMRWPGRIPAGLRVAEQASGVDVLPTAFELLGLDAPGGVRGQSLAPLLRGVLPPDLREQAFSQVADHDPSHQGTSVRATRFKYIRTRRLGEELYDLAGDPGEVRNLLPGGRGAEAVGALRARMEAFEQTVSQEAPELDPELADQLRALGYVDGP